jgi:hypothetical protein
LANKDSSILFSDVTNHVSIVGVKDLFNLSFHADGAMLTWIGAGRYLLSDIKSNRVKLTISFGSNHKTDSLYAKEFTVEKAGIPSVSFVKEREVRYPDGQLMNDTRLAVKLPNPNYKGPYEVAHFEISVFKDDGSVFIPATFISGNKPGKTMIDQVKLLKSGKINFDQIVLHYDDGPYQKYNSFSQDIR